MATWPDALPDVRYWGDQLCAVTQLLSRRQDSGRLYYYIGNEASAVEHIFIYSTCKRGAVDIERCILAVVFNALRVGWRPPLLDSENRGLATRPAGSLTIASCCCHPRSTAAHASTPPSIRLTCDVKQNDKKNTKRLRRLRRPPKTLRAPRPPGRSSTSSPRQRTRA